MGAFEVRWTGDIAAPPEVVWDAITLHSEGWLWPIRYEPRAGGVEDGLSSDGGVVDVWDPPARFSTASTHLGRPNRLDRVLTATSTGTRLDYRHAGEFADDEHAVQLDACRRHTDLYLHSLGQYAEHFPGRTATYVTAAPSGETPAGGFAAARRALGLPDDVAAGAAVHVAIPGVAPIDGVVDHASAAFLGIRTADSLYRVYGRDLWGWGLSVAHHRFAPAVDAAAESAAWTAWLDALLATTAAGA